MAQILATVLLPVAIPLMAVSDLIALLLILALVVAFGGSAFRRRGRLRAFWLLQAVSWSIFLVNQVWWTYYDLVVKEPVPLFFAGDVLPFFAVAFMLSACLLRPHAQQTRTSVRRGTLDFILLMVWWFYVYLYLVLTWQFVSPNERLFNRNYDILYLAANLLLMVVLVVLVVRSEEKWKRFYGLFLGVVLLRYASFQLENRAIEANAYFSGSWYDSLYCGVFAVFILLAMEGRKLEISGQNASLRKETYGFWMAGLAILAVLSLPVILLFAANQRNVPIEVTEFRVLVTAGAMFVMAGLAFMKQFLMHEELKHANHALEESAMTDALTGVRNRRFFLETIRTDLAHTVRTRVRGDRNGRDMIFYLIDLDDFKKINDVLGHDAGDSVLKEAAQRMKMASRDSDVLVRWGGEEFLIVSRHADRENAEILAQRVLDAIRSNPYALSEHGEVRLTCSIGWAAFPWVEENIESQGYEEVLKIADRALYRAKRAGKDQAVGAAHGDGESAKGDELEVHIFARREP